MGDGRNFQQIRRIGCFLIAGSVHIDIIAQSLSISLAKLMAIGGIVVLVATRPVIPRLTATELAFFFVLPTVVILNLFFYPSGYPDSLWSIINSLLIGCGLVLVMLTFEECLLGFLLIDFVNWGVVASVIGLIQAATGRLFFTERFFISETIPGTHRASGFCEDPNYFGLLCLLAVPIAAFYFRKSKDLSWLVRLSILLLAAVLSGSRSTLITLAIGLPASGLFLRRHVASWLKYAVTVGLLLVVAGFALRDRMPENVAKMLDPSYYTEQARRNSLQDRFLVSMIAWEVGRAHPTFGYGIGNIRNHPFNRYGMVSHNNYLELFSETGTVGLIAYLLLLLQLFRKLRRTSLSSCDSTALLSAHLFVALAGFTVMSCSLVTYYSRMWFFFVGLLFIFLRFDGRSRTRKSVPRGRRHMPRPLSLAASRG